MKKSYSTSELYVINALTRRGNFQFLDSDDCFSPSVKRARIFLRIEDAEEHARTLVNLYTDVAPLAAFLS